MKLRVVATGTRPLLMHNVQLASPMNYYAKMMKEISAKKTKTEDDRRSMAQIEFYGGLYIDSVVGPYIPGEMILASTIEGGRLTKRGRHVERAVNVCDLINPLIYPGPRTADELWGDGSTEFVDMRSVRVGQSRVDRTRPIFNIWQVEFNILVDSEVLDFGDMSRVLRDAGEFAGFGDYRKMYGRYTVDIEAINE